MVDAESRVFPLRQGDKAWSAKGTMFHSEFISLKCVKSEKSGVFLGVIIKKKLGGSVLRNLIKRRVRNIFVKLNKINISSGSYLVIARSKTIATCDFLWLSNQVADMAEKCQKHTKITLQK